MHRQSRQILVLALPLLILWAWVGCIVICVEETAGCEKTIRVQTISQTDQTSIEPLCPETCAPANPATVKDRQVINTPAVNTEKASIQQTVFAFLPSPARVSPIPDRHLPPQDTSPLFIRFQNFRI
jgi:hypothetical protein